MELRHPALTAGSDALPEGLSLDATTGLISGKIGYSAEGSYDLDIVATDSDGATSTAVQFTWTVGAAAIGYVRATERHGSSPLSNTFDIFGVSTDVIYTAPGNTVLLTLGPPALGFGVLPDLSDARVEVLGGGAAASTDNFGGSGPVFITPGTDTTTVYVGIDTNDSGTLELGPTGEQTHIFRITPIDFGATKVHSQRTSGPATETNSFEIQETGHFETFSNFEFSLAGGAQGDQSMIRYELWDLDGFDDLLTSGKIEPGDGVSFPYMFVDPVDEGDAFVRFYVDANGNEERDGGELTIDSNDFWVMDQKTYEVSVNISDQITPAPTTAHLQALFEEASNILLRKDGSNDYRAAVELTLASSTPFMSTNELGARPDPVPDILAQQEKHWDAFAGIVFVDDLVGYAGLTDHGDLNDIILDWNSGTDAHRSMLIAHEMGHGLELDYKDTTTDDWHYNPETSSPYVASFLMTEGWTGTMNRLTQTDAKKYDGGP